MPALRTVNLTKRFQATTSLWKLLTRKGHPAITAVDDVSLTVEDGEVFGLLGVNGAGKTTLIKLLSTLLIPTSGNGWIFDKGLIDQPNEVRKLIGLVTSDERSFYWRLTGRQNLAFVAGVYNLPRRKSQKRIEELSDAFGMAPCLDIPFNQYSTGMRQKLAIIRGLLTAPRVLFMDEPTKGLDPIAAAEFLDLIGKKVIPWYKITVLITTHILREAEVLCDRVAIMQSGKIMACDSPARLQNSFSGFEVYSLKIDSLAVEHLVQIQRIDGVLSCNSIPGTNGSVDLELRFQKGCSVLSDVFAFLVSENCAILSCDHHCASLEEVFSSIIQGDKKREEIS